MTEDQRLNKQVRIAADAASGEKGCNRCHKRRPAEKVKPYVRSDGKRGFICDWCHDAIEANKRKKK